MRVKGLGFRVYGSGFVCPWSSFKVLDCYSQQLRGCANTHIHSCPYDHVADTTGAGVCRNSCQYCGRVMSCRSMVQATSNNPKHVFVVL